MSRTSTVTYTSPCLCIHSLPPSRPDSFLSSNAIKSLQKVPFHRRIHIYTSSPHSHLRLGHTPLPIALVPDEDAQRPYRVSYSRSRPPLGQVRMAYCSCRPTLPHIHQTLLGRAPLRRLIVISSQRSPPCI